MRKIIISFCILLAALSLKAQPVSGIRIDGGDTPILVYFNEIFSSKFYWVDYVVDCYLI